MPDPRDMLRQAIDAIVPPVAPATADTRADLGAMVDAGYFGRTRAEQTAQLVRRAGTNPRTGRPYSARTVQRWLTEGAQRRTPPAAVRDRLRRSAAQIRGRDLRAAFRDGAVLRRVSGEISVGVDTRSRSIRQLRIEGAPMREVLDHHTAGRHGAALDAFSEGLGAGPDWSGGTPPSFGELAEMDMEAQEFGWEEGIEEEGEEAV